MFLSKDMAWIDAINKPKYGLKCSNLVCLVELISGYIFYIGLYLIFSELRDALASEIQS